jgi:Ca2+-binding RTX toxin-like protein
LEDEKSREPHFYLSKYDEVNYAVRVRRPCANLTLDFQDGTSVFSLSDWHYSIEGSIGSLFDDTLTGGAGNDTIRFDSVLNATTNRDTLTDFSVDDDSIELENAIFTALTTTGTLAVDSFHIGASAGDADDHVIYNSATGALFYDSDGSGGSLAVQFATLSAGLALTNTDFFVT